jgi:methylthioribose-1-phosphate isomerase
VEKRSGDEVATIEGWNGTELITVRLIPEGSPALNFGFDITPARLVTGLITERGICPATREGIAALFKEKNL